MSWFRRLTASAVQEAPAAPIPPARVYTAPRMADDERRLYVEKAKAVGVINGSLKLEMLTAFLKETGIGSYPLDKVESYLDHLFGVSVNSTPTWGWRPLRDDDSGKLVSSRSSWFNGTILRGTYQGAVPFPVLETVARIAEAVPDVHFYVSDLTTPSDGDPFLGVSAVGMNMIIVERWDEPSFRA